MAAVTMDLMLDSSTDANFREWGKAISDQLAAFRWVKTADTGQIDWSTVTTSTALGSVRGYEVWRMNDTLQATAPVFLKIEYSTGTGSGNAAAPRIFVTLGTGANGAGTLTGQVGARVEHRFFTSAGATTRFRCLFSGDPSRFDMCLGITTENNNQSLWLDIERSKDTAGADTAEGVVRIGGGYISDHQQFLPMTGSIPPDETNLGCLAPANGTGTTGTDVILYPIFPSNRELKNPVRGALGYFKSDITQDWIVQVSLYGIPHNFYVVGHAVEGPVSRSTNSVDGLALRYE